MTRPKRELDSPAPILERDHDRPASLDNPRAPRADRGMPNFEKYAWLFMRFSGVALIFLVLGHLFIMLMLATTACTASTSTSSRSAGPRPFWQIWDLSLLWLAQLHGGNGMRTIIADYARKDSTKFWLNTLLVVSMILITGAGHLRALHLRPEHRCG